MTFEPILLILAFAMFGSILGLCVVIILGCVSALRGYDKWYERNKDERN